MSGGSLRNTTIAIRSGLVFMRLCSSIINLRVLWIYTYDSFNGLAMARDVDKHHTSIITSH